PLERRRESGRTVRHRRHAAPEVLQVKTNEGGDIRVILDEQHVARHETPHWARITNEAQEMSRNYHRAISILAQPAVLPEAPRRFYGVMSEFSVGRHAASR